MGFLKKITRPISRVLDKIVPNEIKPALPFLAAAAPFMAPGLMSLGGNTMLSRALMSGGLNLGSQLAQEGSEGDFDALSLAMASGIGALSAPGTPGGRTLPDGSGGSYSQVMGGSKLASAGTPSAGQYLRGLSDSGGITDQALNFLGTGADKLAGLSEGLANEGIFSKAGAKALSIPLTQGTMDLASAEARRFEKQQAIDDALASAEGMADSAARAAAIRNSMTAYGFFTDEEIEDTIASAGYRAGGRVGFETGGLGALGAAMEKEPETFSIDGSDIQILIPDNNPTIVGEGTQGGEKMLLIEVNGNTMMISEDEFYNKFGESKAKGGRVGAEEGGLMNLGGREMDMRGGGFIPIGKKERADDVPARLSKNEFVMTADAVRAAGGGSVNKGAKRMYDLMNNLEARV